MTGSQAPGSYRYAAFISYSHAADDRLAPALRDGLHGFAKPWYRRSSMRVFRDETGLGVTPALWPSIETALLDSGYFLLLATPDAAASEWVQREVACWLERRPADHLLIALSRGEIHWDQSSRDFDWTRTDALPRELSRAFSEEPKYVDVRWARTATNLSLRNPDFLTTVASIASTLQDRPLDDLVGEDVRQHRRTRHVVMSTIIVLVALIVVAVVFGVIAKGERDQARRRLVQVDSASGEAAANAGDVSAALLWFTEAAKLEPNHTAEEGLLRTRLASLASRHPRLLHVWTAGETTGGVGFAGDGAWVVVFAHDRSLQAWDAQTGSPAFQAMRRPVVDVAARGRRLLTIDAHGAYVWDADTGQQLRSVAHDTAVNWAAFSEDGMHVFTLAGDYTARAWEVEDGREIAELPGVDELFDAAVDDEAVTFLFRSLEHGPVVWDSRTQQQVAFDKRNVVAAALSADRRHILIQDKDVSASVWDVKTGQLVTTLGDFQWVDQARLSPDGQRVAMASRNSWAVLWDIPTDREVHTLWHQGAVLDVAFSLDGRRVATASTDKQARVWDIESGKQVTAPLWHEDTVNHTAISPDGTRLVTTTADNVVRLWDLPQAPGLTLPHDEPVRIAAFSSDGTRVLTATDHTARVWDATGNADTPVFVWTPGTQMYHATFSPDGMFVVTTSEDRLARLWDVRTGKQAAALPHQSPVSYAAFSRDGKLLLTASDPGLVVWDLHALPEAPSEPKQVLEAEAPVVYGEFSPDGREILSFEFGGTARVWNLETARERTELRHSEVVLATLSPDGTRMATAGEDRVLRIWDMSSGAQVAQTVQHEYRITAIAFSPDGRRVVTANEGEVRIWDSESGGAVTPPMRHKGRVLHAEFSADSTRVLTASSDRTARVWNAANGEAVTEPLPHGGVVRSAAFSPDGQRIVTASEDNTARLWSLSDGGLTVQEWMRRAQLLAARRIDDTGAVVALSRAEFLELWKNAGYQP